MRERSEFRSPLRGNLLVFTLHDHLPVLSDSSQRDSDQDNRKHDRQIGHAS